MRRATHEGPPINPGRDPKWGPMPSEKGVTVLSIAGTFSEGATDFPFAGVVYKQDATGNIFGNLIDKNGSSRILGRQRETKLVFIKRYDTYLSMRPDFQGNQEIQLLEETSANPHPIYYFFREQNGIWLGRYKSEGTGRRTEAHCRLIPISTPATLFTFTHDNPYALSYYDGVVSDFAAKATEEASTRRHLARRTHSLFRTPQLPNGSDSKVH